MKVRTGRHIINVCVITATFIIYKIIAEVAFRVRQLLFYRFSECVMKYITIGIRWFCWIGIVRDGGLLGKFAVDGRLRRCRVSWHCMGVTFAACICQNMARVMVVQLIIWW